MDQPSQPENSLSTIDDDDEQRRAASVMVATIAAAAGELANAYFGFIRAVVHRNDKKRLTDGRSSARRQKKRTVFDHQRAANAIDDDYLGTGVIPRFDDRQFELQFGINRARFTEIMLAIGHGGNKFFCQEYDGLGRQVARMETRILLALKTIVYGVAAYCFCDYFQMSPQLCRQCLIEFCSEMKKIYEKHWLRMPTKDDVEEIFKLHEGVHGVPGMLGSLDCSQTHWKNCPKAHHGSYVGKEKKPCIVLEAVCDYNLYIWHASYGYCGALNDVNILYLSPLLEHLLGGTFGESEKNVVPYEIAGEEFDKCFLLTDGIYPKFSRFVKANKHPIDPAERRFTAWQESARKDIERGFGVLKAKFQFVSRPIMLRELDLIANRMATCLILHNMCVRDRVMRNSWSTPR